MTPRNIFHTALKILGIFFIRNILDALARVLSVLVYFPQYSDTNEAFFNLGVALPPLVLYTLFTWALLFRTSSIINLLHLDDQPGSPEARIRLHRSTILSIAVILGGGWILVQELPEFFRHAVYYVQERKLYVRMARPDISYLAMSAFKLLIGLILILFNRRVVNMIELRRKQNTPWYWPLKKPARRRHSKVLEK